LLLHTEASIQVDVILAKATGGATILWCMRSGDGQQYWNTGVYREVVPPERLIYTDSFADEQGNGFRHRTTAFRWTSRPTTSSRSPLPNTTARPR
jgi:uncharacterized protein YndB with AHSA1/START domain